jgi:ATP-dependent Clp protease ATP-binding subunit ClpC
MDDVDPEQSSYKALKTMVFDELKNFFRPEFLNRLDETIVFKSLTKPEVREISEFEFNKTFKLVREKGFNITLTEQFKKRVIDEGFNPRYGARPLRRSIMRLLEDELAEALLKAPAVEGEHIVVDLDQDKEVIVRRNQDKDAPIGNGSSSLTAATPATTAEEKVETPELVVS